MLIDNRYHQSGVDINCLRITPDQWDHLWIGGSGPHHVGLLPGTLAKAASAGAPWWIGPPTARVAGAGSADVTASASQLLTCLFWKFVVKVHQFEFTTSYSS